MFIISLYFVSLKVSLFLPNFPVQDKKDKKDKNLHLSF